MSTLLKRGSTGAAVRTLQSLLNDLGASLLVDGDFGAGTHAAVKAAQKRLGLVVDGVAGPQTMAALKAAAAKPAKARPEPDKAAMAKPVPHVAGERAYAVAPPNAASLQLRDTARAIDEIIVHCAATPEGKDFTVDDIRSWHKKRGWSDIGYHYVVYRDGRVMEGRPVGQVGAHCADKGKNKGTIGICYVGGVGADGKTAKDTRTWAQRTSLLWLVEQLGAKFPVKRVTGHNQYAAKACPSFDVRQDDLGRWQDAARPAAVPVFDAHAQPKAAFAGPLIGGIVAGILKDRIGGALETLVRDENSPVTRGAVPSIVETVAKEVLPQIIDQVVPEVAERLGSVAENAANQEPWYRSRVIIGNLVAGAALGAGLIGVQVDGAMQGEIVGVVVDTVEAVSSLIAVAGVVYSLYGRIRGNTLKPLGR